MDKSNTIGFSRNGNIAALPTQAFSCSKENSILVVGANGNGVDTLKSALARAGYQSEYASGLDEAVRMAHDFNPELVLLNSSSSGVDDIRRLRQGACGCLHPVMVLSSRNDATHAVDAMRAGAVDYLIKPYRMEELLRRIRQALEALDDPHSTGKSNRSDAVSTVESEIVASSSAMRPVMQLARQLAQQGASTLLIRGETGVGKDLMARYIHRNSPRREKEMIEINCPSFPSALLESELFGHERGAFTGANSSKKGLFEIAHGGTAFLNEIGEIDMGMQAKLLQFMENKVFRRVGSTRERRVDARIVAATNQPLEEAIRQNRFRSDLYYRLNVVPIYIPPLRERLEDIPLLIEHFLGRMRREFQRPALRISSEALHVFMRFEWPGNVREMKNCLERMALLCTDDVLGADLLPEAMLRASRREQYSDALFPVSTLDEHEKRLLSNALREAQWNQCRAARILNISRDTLRYRIKKHGIVIPSQSAH